MSLRLAFMGTPDFAVPTLKALLAAPHEIVAVYTQPPRPKGRGYTVEKSSIHRFAEEASLPVYTPETLKDPESQDIFRSLNLDLAVVVAYGLILPQSILDAPRWGCVNVHASLLPRWRGAAPIQRAILAGDDKTGVTIMKMEAGLDTGPMLAKVVCPLTLETTATSLHNELAQLGATLIVPSLDDYVQGRLTPEPQKEEEAVLASKLHKSEGLIQWSKSADEIHRQIRALNPWPGSYFLYEGQPIKVVEAQIQPHRQGEPGQVIDTPLVVACGQGAIALLRLQRSGGQVLPVQDFLNGFPLRVRATLIH